MSFINITNKHITNIEISESVISVLDSSISKLSRNDIYALQIKDTKDLEIASVIETLLKSNGLEVEYHCDYNDTNQSYAFVEFFNSKGITCHMHVPTEIESYIEKVKKHNGVEYFLNFQRINKKIIYFDIEHAATLLPNIVLLKWLFNSKIQLSLTHIKDIKDIFEIEKSINELQTHFPSYNEWLTLSLNDKICNIDGNIMSTTDIEFFAHEDLKEIFYKLFGVKNDTEDNTDIN